MMDQVRSVPRLPITLLMLCGGEEETTATTQTTTVTANRFAEQLRHRQRPMGDSHRPLLRRLSPTHSWQTKGSANSNSVGIDNGTLVGVTFGPGVLWNTRLIELWGEVVKSFRQ